MSKVTEITYYAPRENRKDWTIEHEMIGHMKRIWKVSEYTLGTVFIGEHAGTEYAAITFASHSDYADLQDHWHENSEWLAVLDKYLPHVKPVVARSLLNLA